MPVRNDLGAVAANSNLHHERTLEQLLEREAWIAGQRHAFELALSDCPMETSLGVLVETATTALGPGTRGAIFLASADGTILHHLVGMPEEYAREVDGIDVGPEALACGLAIHLGAPVLTSDIRVEPRWQPWAWLAEKWGYRACWSFPIRAKTGTCIGAFTVYIPDPREATAYDVEHISLITQTAAIVISRHNEAEERKQVEQSLRETQVQLETELADSELLRQLSLELADDEDEYAIYDTLVRAAAKIMRSDVCTVQYFHPERGPAGELEMLASTGLDETGVKYWKWVRGDSGCTCGQVLRTGKRAIAEEVRTCSFMAGKPDRDILLGGGIEAGQSTPLVSRSGKLVGMISTHWSQPHSPTERELRMLDIIARPAADMIERRRAAETQRLLLNELNHRVKNTLAVVQAMATRTLAKTSDPREFSKAFGGRVQALARIHDLLSATSWHGADLRELVSAQVSGGSDDARLEISGPAVQLDPQMALHVALIVHELGTNATKYGALSAPAGRVVVTWNVSDALHLRWAERGGPRVEPSSTTGFGTTLITQSARGQGGEATMTAEPEGVIWNVTLPYTCKGSSTVGLEPPRKAATVARVDDASVLAGKYVLVVEDEPLIGLDIVAALEDAGAKVHGPLATVEDACDFIAREKFDVALVDANLRGRSVEAIAEALSTRAIPFAFATGYDKSGLPEGFRDTAILGKPCAPEQVVEMVSRLLAR